MKKDKLTPKISVIMPVYNEEKFLDESIQSILNQTFKDFEFIIINDASTDNSLKIIKSYDDKRISLINLKKNVGFPGSRNIGAKRAKGKYIANLGADDVAHPRRLEKQFNYLEKNPNIFLIGSSTVYIKENGDEMRRFRKYDNHKMLAWRLPKSCGIVEPSTMLHNEDVLYNEHFEGASDYDFFLNLLKRGKNLTNLPEFLIKYRLHENSMTISNKKEQEHFRDETRRIHKNLNKNVAFFSKLYYSIELIFHFIKTMNEKKIFRYKFNIKERRN